MTTYGWALRRTADPPIEPVTLDEARAQCQVDADLTEHDARLTSYIKAARELAEEYTKRSFVEQEWLLTLWAFSTYEYAWGAAYPGAIVLPRGPVIAVNSLKYYDASGTQLTLDPSSYLLDASDEPSRLYPAYNQFWPSAAWRPGAVEVAYKAGYQSAGSPTDAATVPERARQAILALVSHWFANREAVDRFGASELPYGFERSLDSLRVYP